MQIKKKRNNSKTGNHENDRISYNSHSEPQVHYKQLPICDHTEFKMLSEGVWDKLCYIKSHCYKLTFFGNKKLCPEGFEHEKVEKWAFLRYHDLRILVVYFKKLWKKKKKLQWNCLAYRIWSKIQMENFHQVFTIQIVA